MPVKARCGRADEIPAGGSKVVEIKGQNVAIFKADGVLYAVENTCPHQGGPLGEGYLEDNCIVSCPWHAWSFDVTTGINPMNSDIKQPVFQVTLEGNDVCVEVP